MTKPGGATKVFRGGIVLKCTSKQSKAGANCKVSRAVACRIA